MSNDLGVPSYEWIGHNKNKLYREAKGRYFLALAKQQGHLPANKLRALQNTDKPHLITHALAYAREPRCEAQIENICTTVAQDIHHKAGRGRWLTIYTPLFMAVCRSCHNWIETNKEEAQQNGWYYAYQVGAAKVTKRAFMRSSRKGNADGKFHTQQTTPEEYNNQPLLPTNLSKRRS